MTCELLQNNLPNKRGEQVHGTPVHEVKELPLPKFVFFWKSLLWYFAGALKI